MVTIKDIAKAANVSIATVSRVVNNNGAVTDTTRNRVLKVISDLGYRPNSNARALVKRQPQSLGLVIADWHGPFFSSLACGVEQVARERNASLLVSTGALQAETERAAIELLLEQQCKALVVHSKFLSDKELIALSREAPMVFINRYIPVLADRCVWLDNILGGQLMAEHLLALEHHKLLLLNSNQTISDATDRQKGIMMALNKAGVELPETHILSINPNFDGGEQAITQLLRKGTEFSAILAYNDAVACGAMAKLQDVGIDIPNDISIIGFDNTMMARYSRPALTSMEYPIQEMAQLAANLALDFASAELTTIANFSAVYHGFNPMVISRNSTTQKR
ncbi:LacI family DNA-binding transcriptional regulator [Shewanella sp. Isolate11]|uniref:LacI family DNA-binding transcriptional regulator n=1 Tax=Shewanella sp. Isolate11 TaxID=2908530 RepID=UPI001EFC5914|nr:LacI family DNA-binding transcriptional regulator [Shewanella sp. Isolate11]MCG9697929.1 LacI family DNA-binding transcriptional regulator [Shewanella sp. Isolate11]